MLFGDSMKKIMLAGIGAVAVTAEKSKELVDELVVKGELTVEQGKVLNEELKHKVKDTIKDNVQIQIVQPENKTPAAEHVISQMENYTPEELNAIRQKLDTLTAKKQSADTQAATETSDDNETESQESES